MNGALPEINYKTRREDCSVQVCKTCANEFQGKFCNWCGEKVIDPHERSIVHFLEGVFHTITHADGKIFKNLKLILLRPGRLSKNLADGIRQPFMKPISMFFVANLIYFLFPVFQSFNTSLYSQARLQVYSGITRPMMEKKMEKEKISFEDLQKKYNAKTATLSKLLLILVVPMFALLLTLINYRKDRFFADHLLLALEFMCFFLFYNLIAFGFLVYGVIVAGNWLGFDFTVLERSEWTFSVYVSMALILYFVYRAERTFYDQNVVKAIVKSLLFFLGFPVIFFSYRFLLFIATIHSI